MAKIRIEDILADINGNGHLAIYGAQKALNYGDIAVGEHENGFYVETINNSSRGAVMIYDKKKSRLRSAVVNPITLEVADGSFGSCEEDKVLAAAMLLVLVQYELTNRGDIVNSINHLSALIKANPGVITPEISSVLLDIRDGFLMLDLGNVRNAFEQNHLSIDVCQIAAGRVAPAITISGKFQIFQVGQANAPVKTMEVDREKMLTEFRIVDPDRVFDEEEQANLYQVPDRYAFSQNVISTAKKIKASWSRPEHLRKKNILFEGPAGTGKTQDSQVLSAMLGLPYTKITCFSDMDSSSVTGQILPVMDAEEGHKKPTVSSLLPTEEEVEFDPEGCYEQLTGEAKEGVSIEEVKHVLMEKSMEYYKSGEGQNSPEYVYYASELTKAFERGWLCEIQEPTCIADAAVLLILNSALDNGGVINLPQRTAKRHPEFICVLTTNRNYEGCRPLNQALRDRMNITKNVVLPDAQEICERLIASTGAKDRAFVNVVVQSVLSLNKFLDNEGFGATVSLRGMQDFLADVIDGFDVMDSFYEACLWKITTDETEIAEIQTFLENATELGSAEYQAN